MILMHLFASRTLNLKSSQQRLPAEILKSVMLSGELVTWGVYVGKSESRGGKKQEAAAQKTSTARTRKSLARSSRLPALDHCVIHKANQNRGEL